MDRFNFARNHPSGAHFPLRGVRLPSKGNTPAPARGSSENAWANANRAWMIACRLAASRR